MVFFWKLRSKTNSAQMKTLRMFGMALVAIIMGVSLSSCNKDENPENDGDFSNEKKLVKEVWEEDGATTTYSYIYDDYCDLHHSTGRPDYYSH